VLTGERVQLKVKPGVAVEHKKTWCRRLSPLIKSAQELSYASPCALKLFFFGDDELWLLVFIEGLTELSAEVKGVYAHTLHVGVLKRAYAPRDQRVTGHREQGFRAPL
jgi:hypothetical protein